MQSMSNFSGLWIIFHTLFMFMKFLFICINLKTIHLFLCIDEWVILKWICCIIIWSTILIQNWFSEKKRRFSIHKSWKGKKVSDQFNMRFLSVLSLFYIFVQGVILRFTSNIEISNFYPTLYATFVFYVFIVTFCQNQTPEKKKKYIWSI